MNIPKEASTAQRRRKWDRVFFSAMSLLLMSVLLGFARTYFLAGMLRAPLPNLLIHLHGAAFTSWILLLLAQNALIINKNVKIHRNLGMGGFVLAIAMVILGVLAAIDSLRRGFTAPGLDAKTFFVFPVTDMILFSLFVFFAYKFRLTPEAHKRLILIASIALMNAAVGRRPLTIIREKPVLSDFVLFAFLLLIVGYDFLSLRRASRTTLWASAVLILVHVARLPFAMTRMWHSFADLLARSSI
jgi:hypothetical protein